MCRNYLGNLLDSKNIQRAYLSQAKMVSDLVFTAGFGVEGVSEFRCFTVGLRISSLGTRDRFRSILGILIITDSIFFFTALDNIRKFSILYRTLGDSNIYLLFSYVLWDGSVTLNRPFSDFIPCSCL